MDILSIYQSIYYSIDLPRYQSITYRSVSNYESTNLPIYQATNLYTDLSFNLSSNLTISAYQSTELFIYQPTNLVVYQPSRRTINTSFYQSTIHSTTDISMGLSAYCSINLPTYHSTDLSSYAPVGPSPCRSINLSMYQFRSTELKTIRTLRFLWISQVRT